MITNESTLKTKVSPLIEGQVPDFIQADHPIFVTFLKHYYEFLESGELKLTLTLDNILQETVSVSHIVDETKGEKIVLEAGVGSTGKFINGETITGSTSKATAKVLVEDGSNGRLFISAQQKFITGETVTGGTSSSTGVIISYRGNPVQNIQQLMEYATPDNTIDDFLDNFRNQFMNAIPSTLADGVSKRNLIKSIKELYTAKGTSEGHKFFLRLLLDDEATILYPEKFMMRISQGKWSTQKTIRTSIPYGVDPSEFVGEKISSIQYTVSAIVVAAKTIVEGNTTLAEYELDPNSITGDFTIDDIVTCISTTRNLLYKFTVAGIITQSNISDGGILHNTGETVTHDTSIGNGLATKEIDHITVGSVDDVILDDVGTKYDIGDSLIFNAGSQSNTADAAGFVSAVGGMMILEDDSADQILQEVGTNSSLVNIKFRLEDGTGVLYQEDGTTGSGLGGLLINQEIPNSLDTYGTLSDGFMFEENTLDASILNEDGTGVLYQEDGTIVSTTFGQRLVFEDSLSTAGEIRKIFLSNNGAGYSALPLITITTATGTGADVYASTSTIGVIDDVKITNAGYNYPSTAPRPIFKIPVLVKDITGTFSANTAVMFGTFDANEPTAGTIHSVDISRNTITVLPTAAAPFFTKQEDGTTVSTTFGDDILFEDGGFIIQEKSFHTGEKDVTISTSTGTAVIVKSHLPVGTLTTGVVSTAGGTYPIDQLNTIGQDIVRIQDSKYYQQFSYEVQVGSALSDFLASLKKAVHPSGFQPFGKVKIASKIVAGISVLTGKDIPDYTGDTDTFTPELASIFSLVFDTAFGRRLGTSADGTTLNATPMVGITDNFLTDSNLGIGSGKRDVTLESKMKLVIPQQPVNRSNPNALKVLNKTPFLNTFTGIDLETYTNEAGSTATNWDHSEITGTIAGATSNVPSVVLDAVTSSDIRIGMFAYNNAGISSVVKVNSVTGTSPNYTIGLDTNLTLANDSTIKFQYDFSSNVLPTFDQGPTTPYGRLILDGVMTELANVTNSRSSIGDVAMIEDGIPVGLVNIQFTLEDGTLPRGRGILRQEDGTTGSGLGGLLLNQETDDPLDINFTLENEIGILRQENGTTDSGLGDVLLTEDTPTIFSQASDDKSSPRFDLVGSISFDDIFQYHVVRLENIDFILLEDDPYSLRQEDGTTGIGLGDFFYQESETSKDDESESVILEDGFDLLLEVLEQQTENLPWQDSIWTHAKEKVFTYPSTIVVR